MPDPGPQLLLVPGAFSGPWMWADVAAGLAARDLTASTVTLPTVGEETTATSFADDVQAVRDALDALDAPVVLCGHSYGGAVITAAAAGPHPNVRELVYVAGAAPASGGSMASATAAAAERAGSDGDGGPAPREDGLMVFPPDAAAVALFGDCDDARAADGVAHLQPQSFAGTDAPIPTAAWTQLPSVYVRATEDLVPRALGDGFLESCVAVLELPTGHCPQWSRPELVVELLAERAA